MSLLAVVFMSILGIAVGGHANCNPLMHDCSLVTNPSTNVTNQTLLFRYMSQISTSAFSTVICSLHSVSVIGWYISIMDLMRTVIYMPRERPWRNTCIPVTQWASLLAT